MDNAYIPGKRSASRAATWAGVPSAMNESRSSARSIRHWPTNSACCRTCSAPRSRNFTAGESLGLSATDAKRAAGGRRAMTPERTAKQKRRYRLEHRRNARHGAKMKLARAAKRAA